MIASQDGTLALISRSATKATSIIVFNTQTLCVKNASWATSNQIQDCSVSHRFLTALHKAMLTEHVRLATKPRSNQLMS